MDKIAKRKCSVCGKEFSPKVHNAIVCSDKCRKARKSKAVKKVAPKAGAKPKPKAKGVKGDGELRFNLYIFLIKPGDKPKNKGDSAKLKTAKN